VLFAKQSGYSVVAAATNATISLDEQKLWYACSYCTTCMWCEHLVI